MYKGLGANKSSSFSGNRLVQSVFDIPVENKFGSYAGLLALAITCPVFTSIATTAPELAIYGLLFLL